MLIMNAASVFRASLQELIKQEKGMQAEASELARAAKGSPTVEVGSRIPCTCSHCFASFALVTA